MSATLTRRPRRTERIAPGASGCFLDPPTFPTHRWHVATDTLRRRENWGWASLTFAAECEWIAAEVREKAAELVAAWYEDRPSIDRDEIQDWIQQVLGYFRHCYTPASGSRNASDLVISRDLDPLENADRHAGVLMIRNFYPEFAPTAEHFGLAYWGTKPQA